MNRPPADTLRSPVIFRGDDSVNFGTDRGKLSMTTVASPTKEENEDSVMAMNYGDDILITAVADGLGGLPAGRSASTTVVSCIADVLTHAQPTGIDSRAAILDAIELANEQLLDGGLGNASTLVLVEINRTTVRPYHVGDSQIMVTGQRGKIKLLTVPHSPTGYGVESGLIEPDAALHHAQRHYVSNVVGSIDMRIEVGATLELAPKDTLILASDGLWDNLYVDEVADTIRIGPVEKACANLREKARQRMLSRNDGKPSHPDDLSFALYRPG